MEFLSDLPAIRGEWGFQERLTPQDTVLFPPWIYIE